MDSSKLFTLLYVNKTEHSGPLFFSFICSVLYANFVGYSVSILLVLHTQINTETHLTNKEGDI